MLPLSDIVPLPAERKASSSLPLWRRLGLKEQTAIVFLWAPPGMIDKIKKDGSHILPDHAIEIDLRFKYDNIISFITSRFALQAMMPQILDALGPRGSLWIALPNENSGIPTDLKHRTIRELCAANSLLEKKLLKIDDEWSAIKFQHDPNKRQGFKELRVVQRFGL